MIPVEFYTIRSNYTDGKGYNYLDTVRVPEMTAKSPTKSPPIRPTALWSFMFDSDKEAYRIFNWNPQKPGFLAATKNEWDGYSYKVTINELSSPTPSASQLWRLLPNSTRTNISGQGWDIVSFADPNRHLDLIVPRDMAIVLKEYNTNQIWTFERASHFGPR